VYFIFNEKPFYGNIIVRWKKDLYIAVDAALLRQALQSAAEGLHLQSATQNITYCAYMTD
jgi:hypothetical protein